MGKIASSSEKMGLGGTMTGNVIVCDGDGEDRTEDVDEGGGVVVRIGNDGDKVGRPAIAPCVWRVRRIVSQAVSSVLTRSRSA